MSERARIAWGVIPFRFMTAAINERNSDARAALNLVRRSVTVASKSGAWWFAN